HEFNKYNWVSGSVRFGVFNFNGSQDNLTTRTLQNDLLLRSTLQDISMINLSNNIDASLNYVKTFETPRKELSILTQYSQNNRTNDFINASLNEVDESIISQLKNNNQSYNSELTLQLDYVAPLKNDQTLEIGGKTITRTVNSDFTYFLATGPDGAFVPQGQASLTNVFDYNQSVSAGYMTYARNFQKDYSAKIGARYEYTDIHANFLDNLKLDIPAYGLLVPSVNLSKKLAQGNMIKAAYNRRIQRPSLQFLNPNIQAANPKNITQGNPNLAPEFSDNIELTFSTFKKGTSINISTFLRNTNGSIQPVREVIGQDTIYTTYQNIGEEDAYGTSLFANLKLGDKLSINGGFDTYYAVLKNNVADPLYNASNQGFVVSGRVFGSYDFTDKWGLQFFSFIRGRQVQLQGHQSGFYMYSLSVKRDFNNEKGSIGFGAENFLTNGIVRINAVQSAFIDQVNTNVMYNMNFKVNFSYRIGKMDASAAPRRRARSVQNNDLKQGEGNDDMNQRK
ncbi:MAG: outer membrane beta-barrel family protein, partial [Cyclobacteriaceae bacterium]|nr:outer membrane beta-barrel family protein [Cyclobacteriaceae bacterium]